MKTLLLIALLLTPLTASALLCERRGTCADSRLNLSYEIRKEIRRLDQRPQRVRRKFYTLPRHQHKARTDLLHGLKRQRTRENKTD